MYISVKNLDHEYLELSIGGSEPEDEDSNFDYDHNLLVDGMAARIYELVSYPIQIRRDVGKWILLLHYSYDWKKDLERVFTDLQLDFTWKHENWLECPINNYIYSRSANKSTSNQSHD